LGWALPAAAAQAPAGASRERAQPAGAGKTSGGKKANRKNT
jgi:hypothetical protein